MKKNPGGRPRLAAGPPGKRSPTLTFRLPRHVLARMGLFDHGLDRRAADRAHTPLFLRMYESRLLERAAARKMYEMRNLGAI